MLSEAGNNIILLDKSAVDVYAGQRGLSVFVSGDDGAVVVGIEVVAFLEADVAEVVGEFLGGNLDIVIVEIGLVRESSELAADLLEIGVFATGCDHDGVSNFLEPADIGVLCMKGGILKRPP